MAKHVPEWTNIGHNTWGDVCKVCGFDLLLGMSDECVKGKRLWDYHWLPDNKQISFKEPTEVVVSYEYQPIDLGFPEPANTMEKLSQWSIQSVINKQLLNTKFTFIRNNEVIEELNFPEKDIIPADEWKKNHALPNQRLTSLGNRLDMNVIKASNPSSSSATPFLDMMETLSPKPVSDFEYRWQCLTDRPLPKNIGEI